MSRPGHWWTPNGEIPYANMEESHVKNSLRYLRTKLIGQQRDGLPAHLITSTQDKLADLGDEAQRRGLIPAGSLTIEQLLGYISVWQTQYDSRQQRYATRMRPAELLPTTPAPLAVVGQRSGRITVRSARNTNKLDVVGEVSKTTWLAIRVDEFVAEDYRRLDTDL